MPINITIIEGDKGYLQYLKILLGGPKIIKVIGAFTSGKRALNSMANTSPDVAIVDLALPDMPGAKIIKEIKGRFPEVEVLVLTEFDGEKHLFSALKAGAVGYMLKDAKPADIVEAISEVHRGYSPMSGRIARRVLQELHKGPKVKVGGDNGVVLTLRESEVLDLLSRGLKPKKIGEELSIKYESIRTHLKHINKKLYAHSMHDAIARAKSKGLI